MIVAPKTLTDRTAADVMSRAVTTISQDMPLQEAARVLARERISGAPVTDAAGRCVGVVSVTDLLRWTCKQSPLGMPNHADRFDPAGRDGGSDFCSEWQMVDFDEVPKDAVRHYMTSDLVTAEPADRITDLARRMLDARIHRLVVLDAQRRPMGLVTTTDILAAVAQADPCPED